MSEFTSYYRSIGSARESSSAVEYGHVFDLQTRTADFLDALDARVRALEEKFVATELRPSQTETVIYSSASLAVAQKIGATPHVTPRPDREAMWASLIEERVRAAVAEERERCARIADCFTGGGGIGPVIAAEIRRGK